MSVAANETEASPPNSPRSSRSRSPLIWILVLAGIGFLGLVAIVAVFLAGTLLVRSTSSTSNDGQFDVQAAIELGDLEQGCINLGETALDGQVCLTRVDGELEVEVTGFQPGSDLTVTGGGQTVVMTVDPDGTLSSQLSGAITDAPVEVSGTLTDGRSAGVEVGVLD